MGIGTSLVLIAVGAVLAFAVTLDSTIGGTVVHWSTVGWILMIVGVLGLIVSLVWMTGGRRSRVVTRDRIAGPDGERVVERDSAV